MRLGQFFMFQRAAFRALFRRRRRVRLVDLPYAAELHGPPHPSTLCRCYDGQPAGALSDHQIDCSWLAAMCKPCGGTGWCEHCGGDGTAPESRPSADLPPSWVWCGGCQRPGECQIVTCTNHRSVPR